MPLVHKYKKDAVISDRDFLIGSDGDDQSKTKNYYISDLKKVFGLTPNGQIYDIEGLQAALDGKADKSQVLTNVPPNAVFTDTVYVLPFKNFISN